MQSVRIVVVGAGIAGLAAAYRVRERVGQAAELLIVDRSDRLGGKLRTTQLGGAVVESGAESFLMRERGTESAALRLARQVGLGDDLCHPAAVPAALVLDGQLRPMPGGTLFGIPADPEQLGPVANVVPADHDTGQPVLASGADTAVGPLVRARLGDEVVDRFVDPMLGGVYAGRADQLSLAATMPGLYAAARTEPTLRAAVRAALAASPRPAGAPVFATVRGGLSRLVAATSDAAAAQVHLGDPVRELARTSAGWELVVGSTHDPVALTADAVVLAVPAAPAARLLRGVDEVAATSVAALDYASVALVTLALPPGTELPALSGLLVPAAEGYAIKAATFFTRKWPHLAGPGAPVLVRASLGRYGEVAQLQRPDQDLVAVVRRELGALLGGWLPDPIATTVTRWGGSLPQYAVGHLDRVTSARSRLAPTLALAGAGFDGVGIAACVRSGWAAADRVVAALEQSKT
ncbi:MAG TPA: protoporphyrinogen oxidase [Micromonosporaceae bacterium]